MANYQQLLVKAGAVITHFIWSSLFAASPPASTLPLTLYQEWAGLPQVLAIAAEQLHSPNFPRASSWLQQLLPVTGRESLIHALGQLLGVASTFGACGQRPGSPYSCHKDLGDLQECRAGRLWRSLTVARCWVRHPRHPGDLIRAVDSITAAPSSASWQCAVDARKCSRRVHKKTVYYSSVEPNDSF